MFVLVNVARADESPAVANPAIDMPGFLRVAAEAAAYRDARRLTESEFLRLSREPGTMVLDARSREKYDELHIAGAVNSSFPDIALDSLRQTIPDPSTRILIYCNNNFRDAEGPFPTKLPSASLNLSTYIALYTYGYRNIYELGPQLDLAHTLLPFGSRQRGLLLRSPQVPIGRALESPPDPDQRRFAERRAEQLDSDRQAVGREASRQRQRASA